MADLAHTNVQACYQCGKCSAGCPVADKMDLLPNQLVRLVQMGRIDRALGAGTLWECVSCMTCSTRCPKSVDCAGIMDALRQLAVEHQMTSPRQQRTIVFQQAFLNNIRHNGRLREVELIRQFKTRAFFKDLNLPLLFKDVLLAPKMLLRGKLHLMGERAQDRDVVGPIFDRCTNGNGKE